jgi:uncharacterized membrane protein
MNGIRIAISIFVLILITLAGLGWMWTSRHQPPEQAAASHVVLGIMALSGVVALVTIWRGEGPSGGTARRR